MARACRPLLTHLNYHRPALVTAFNDFGRGVRRYMVATTVLGVAQGLFNWLVLVILQVPGALLWGLLSFICSFIPNIGYFIAIVPPLFFGFLTGGWPTVLAVIVIYGGINSVIQSIIQPKYVGNAVALSETITFASVLFWAVILGPVGAILAVPLTLLVPHDPPRLRPGHRVVAALDGRQEGPRDCSSSRKTTRSAPAGHGGDQAARTPAAHRRHDMPSGELPQAR